MHYIYTYIIILTVISTTPPNTPQIGISWRSGAGLIIYVFGLVFYRALKPDLCTAGRNFRFFVGTWWVFPAKIDDIFC